MTTEIDLIKTDFDRAEYLLNMLLDHSTGGSADNDHYVQMRQALISNPNYEEIIPRWIKTNRSINQFWQYIKNKFPSYAERRVYLNEEFAPILEYLENKQNLPAAKSIDEVLSKFDSGGVHFAWQKALERIAQDPSGAITLSRSILESVCKHILHGLNVEFNETNIELSELYKLVASELNLSPDQHSEKIFKQILGGCSGIVNGLGLLRNKYGDAHGVGPKAVKPKPRHAGLSVNLAGSMALFLIQTYEENKEQKVKKL